MTGAVVLVLNLVISAYLAGGLPSSYIHFIKFTYINLILAIVTFNLHPDRLRYTANVSSKLCFLYVD